MKIVGTDFRHGILLVDEVFLAANAMNASMTILTPLLERKGAKPVGGMDVGPDAYSRDAGVAAETARRLIDERRAWVA